MILLSRFICALLLGIAGYRFGRVTDFDRWIPSWGEVAIEFGALLIVGLVCGWLVGGPIGRLIVHLMPRVSEPTSRRSVSELIVGAVGVVLGLIVSALLAIPLGSLDPIGGYLLLPAAILITWYTTSTAMGRHREVLALFGIDADGATARTEAPKKLLDSSALIDGRVRAVAESGFLEGTLVVPVFVLEELQRIADDNDPLKRARGRRGLDIVTRLRKEMRLETIDDDPRGIKTVDAKLVRLAGDNGWTLVTNDLALIKVAEAQDVPSLNINVLANALKPDFLPGEQLDVRIVRTGKEAGQGVGYLDDGTMVIVDGGAEHVGSAIHAHVSSQLQNASGKLVFARIQHEGEA